MEDTTRCVDFNMCALGALWRAVGLLTTSLEAIATAHVTKLWGKVLKILF
ncbi:MAG: hypothetical protein ACTS68_01615 [Candidatus Hodgkinia cicadicola]